MKIGYVRVSTEEQNTARQELLMAQLGVEKLFIDKASGKSKDRPSLEEMLAFVREGDTVIVESISRFARNTKDLLNLVEKLTEKKVEFISKKEAIDTSTPCGKFMLTVFGAMAQLEREQICSARRRALQSQRRRGNIRAASRLPWTRPCLQRNTAPGKMARPRRNLSVTSWGSADRRFIGRSRNTRSGTGSSGPWKNSESPAREVLADSPAGTGIVNCLCKRDVIRKKEVSL